MIVGLDPSQRHTGVCVINPELKIIEAYDIKTDGMNILEAGLYIRAQLGILMDKYPRALYSVEKMMPNARNGALLFYVQMILLEEMEKRTTKRLCHLLPIQLKSFMKKLTGKVPDSKSEIVNAAKVLTSFRGRMSSHMADAYFLARAGDQVLSGQYEYNLSEVELPLYNWEILGGVKSSRRIT